MYVQRPTRCPLQGQAAVDEEQEQCVFETVHYGTGKHKVTDADYHLKKRFGVGSTVTPTLRCTTHNVVFHWVKFNEENRSDCQCPRCQDKRELEKRFSSNVAAQQIGEVPQYRPRSFDDINDVPF